MRYARWMGLLLCLGAMGCGYGWSQAVRDAGSPQPATRQKALDYLIKYISRTTGTKGDNEKRRRAIRAMGDTKIPRAAGALRMVLQHETDPPLRKEAIRSLGRLRAGSALQELREALLKDKDLDVRMLAAATLGRVGDRRALNDLIKALKDPQPAVRTAAIRALELLRATRAIPYLIDGLCDAHIDVRTASTKVLLKMKKAALPWLLKELDFRNARRRKCVVTFFPKMGEFALRPLIKAFAEKSKRAGAKEALIALTQDTVTWPIFSRMLDEPDTYDGRNELAVLKKTGTLATVHSAFALWYKLPVRYRLIFRNMLGVIAQRDGDKGRKVLKEAALSGPDLAYRSTAVIAIGDTGSKAIPVLRSFLQSTKRALLVSALYGLGKVGPKGLPLLLPYLKSDDEDLRIAALRAVGHIRDPKAKQILLDGLKDKGAKIRMESLKGLALQKDKGSIPTIRKLLTDPIIDVVMTAIQTLLRLGDTRNARLYIQALKRGPYPPKPAYVRTLGELGDKRAIPLLKKLVKRYLRDWKRYRKKAERLFKRKLRRMRSQTITKKIREDLRDQVRQKLKESEAVNPMALCSFFESLRALLKLNFPAHQIIGALGQSTGPSAGQFNPLNRPVDQCPWPALRAVATPK